MTRTYLSVAEKTSPTHRSLYILHNGFQWYHSDTNSDEQMKKLLDFFECEIELERTTCTEERGTIKFYNVSKDIVNADRDFWNFEQLQERINNRRVKTFIGLSNGSLVPCYAVFNDEENTIEILRPNPNAKNVYITMPIEAEIEYRKKHWFL